MSPPAAAPPRVNYYSWRERLAIRVRFYGWRVVLALLIAPKMEYAYLLGLSERMNDKARNLGLPTKDNPSSPMALDTESFLAIVEKMMAPQIEH